MDWFPLNIESYDTDTLTLTLAEDGAYGRLIRWYYRSERPLPNDEVALAGICRISVEQWREIAPKVLRYFEVRNASPERHGDVTNTLLFHDKCDAVIFAQTKHRRDGAQRQRKYRERGMKPGKPKRPGVTRDKRVSNTPKGEERNIDIDAKASISSSPAAPMTFAAFWEVYPRKVGKLAAEPVYERLRKAGKLPSADQMRAAIDRYVKTKPADIDYCHPKTWLNGGRWLDQVEDAAPTVTQTSFELPADAAPWRRRLLEKIGAEKYRSWIAATELRAAENKGHFYVKSNFAATWLATNMLKEIAFAVGCDERDIVFHVRPSQKEQPK